jgi:predicted peptidase
LCIGAVAQTADGDYEARVFHGGEGKSLPYRLLKPRNYDPHKTYPLVLFLHGAGERGDDNQAQMRHVVSIFQAQENREKFPCFVVVPQCPSNEGWSEGWPRRSADEASEKSVTPIGMTMQVLEELRKEFNIDARRQYVMGLSMGGFGAWYLIARHPEMFAAAVPMCGGGVPDSAPSIAKIPIWAFHGAKDDVVPVRTSREMVDALKKAGGDPRYTEYPDCAHDCWELAAKDPELLAWLFSQRLGGASAACDAQSNTADNDQPATGRSTLLRGRSYLRHGRR